MWFDLSRFRRVTELDKMIEWIQEYDIAPAFCTELIIQCVNPENVDEIFSMVSSTLGDDYVRCVKSCVTTFDLDLDPAVIDQETAGRLNYVENGKWTAEFLTGLLALQKHLGSKVAGAGPTGSSS